MSATPPHRSIRLESGCMMRLTLFSTSRLMIPRRIISVSITVVAMLTAFGCNSGSGDSIISRAIDSTLGIYTGQVEPITESVGIFVWGHPLNQLCHQWSVARYDQSGWFYGTNYSWSSADVYVLPAPNDPLSVVAAENFNYTRGSVEAYEGDTVFFRGRNGYFGAWTIESIEGRGDAVLSGVWYFKSGGGGDFTSAIVGGGTSDYDPNVGVCDGF